MPYVEGEMPTVVTGGGSRDSGNGFLGDGIWAIIALAIVFGAFGGWGNGGWGGGSGGSGVQGALTRGDLCQDMNFNNLESAVRNVNDSVNVRFANLNSTICNQQYDTARMINGLNTTMLQGFNGINVTNLQGFNSIQSQIAQCCCNLERGQERIACGEAQNTAAIISSGQANTQRILDYLCNEKIASLQSAAQSQYIINSVTEKLLPVAKPAYLTCSPYASAYGYPYGNFGGSCNCGGTTIQ